MSQKRSRVLPVVLGAVGAYLIFVIATVMVWEPSEKTPDDLDWEDRERHNLQQIATLQPGVSVDQVVLKLGSPTFSEAYSEPSGDLIQILRYRTHRTEGDGKTTFNETTPLVFRNGTLNSWGDAALQKLTLGNSG
ncbi:DUF3192 domain-containing protein [uncultured Ferrimonas sp.]|uniref:DUF3192 domain-containing protein n=1 Tax=uncultured Ferrimonas sp. TaxID=432640 RepID=UPI00260E4BEF|nr:DUF3192 domain-containing protein [uncultured Ferrimonas sp.]